MDKDSSKVLMILPADVALFRLRAWAEGLVRALVMVVTT